MSEVDAQSNPGAYPEVPRLPEKPLQLLDELYGAIKTLTGAIRQELYLLGAYATDASGSRRYSALMADPATAVAAESNVCFRTACCANKLLEALQGRLPFKRSACHSNKAPAIQTKRLQRGPRDVLARRTGALAVCQGAWRFVTVPGLVVYSACLCISSCLLPRPPRQARCYARGETGPQPVRACRSPRSRTRRRRC